MLTDTEKNLLLDLARQAIEEAVLIPLDTDIQPDPDLPPALQTNAATFVTLRREGELRGCVGSVVADRPLYQDVMENAVQAAFSDPRFPRLKAGELVDLSVSISVLSPFESISITDRSELYNRLRRDHPGLYLNCTAGHALFLPEVWDSFKEPESFVTELVAKAGLRAEHPFEDLRWSVFSTYRFPERLPETTP